jgi:hypothetical protein
MQHHVPPAKIAAGWGSLSCSDAKVGQPPFLLVITPEETWWGLRKGHGENPLRRLGRGGGCRGPSTARGCASLTPLRSDDRIGDGGG